MTYIFLCKHVLHLFLSGFAEGICFQGGETVIYGQIYLRHPI